MNAAVAVAVGMTRTWVALYTLGLPPPLRDARRAEIDCDLWEQRRLAEYTHEPPLGTAAEIAARTVLGMLSDITWRVEAGASARPDRSIKMNESLLSRAFFALALVVAAFPILQGAGVVAAGEDFDSWIEQVLFGMATMASGALAIAGLILSRKRPWAGIALIAAATAVLSALWYWTLLFTVPIGIALAGFAFLRGRRAWRGRTSGPSQPQPA